MQSETSSYRFFCAFQSSPGSPEDFHPDWGTRVLAAIPDFQFLYGHSAEPLALPGPDVTDNGAAKHSTGSKTAGLRRRLLLHSNGKVVTPQMNLVTKWLPGSMVAEQYRVAATRLALVGAKNGATVVAVTSAIKGEGKTTTVVNLGYTLARDLGKRTLLVDCDLRCPALHGYVPPGSGVSLVDLLARDASFDGGLARLGDVPCWVLASSLRPIEGNELLKSHRLAALFEDLRREFDYIIINGPPVLPVADMNFLARLADLLFLVVRAGFTPQDVVRQAVEALGNRVPIHVILNAVEARSLPHYMFYSYQADGSGPRRE